MVWGTRLIADVTLEPPAVATWQLKASEVSALIRERGFGVVGHNAYSLPMRARSLRG